MSLRAWCWLGAVLLVGCTRANPLFGLDDDVASSTATSPGDTQADTSVATGDGGTSKGGVEGDGTTHAGGTSLDGPGTTMGADGPPSSEEGPISSSDGLGTSESGVGEEGPIDSGPIPIDPCCTPDLTPGCGNVVIDEACVCVTQPACCVLAWGLTCVAQAVTTCGLECPPIEANDCCTASPFPGCNDWEIMACVCESNEACCALSWSRECAAIAVESCGFACPA